MLKQDINLYQAFVPPIPAITYLPWRQFLYFQLAFVCLMILSCITTIINLQHLASVNENLNVKDTNLTQRFQQEKAKFPAIFFSEDVDLSLKTLQTELDAQEKALRTIASPMAFSRSFIGLSATIVPGVWLTHIELTDSGNTVSLKGHSTNMENLKTLLNNLTHSTYFTKYTLDVNSIEAIENKNQPGAQSFELTLKNKYE